MDYLKIYRRRMIPDEYILLKDDIILERTKDLIITKWNTLKPRQDFQYGYSCYFLNYGYKVSKLYREDNTFLYWYCDIVDYQYKEEGDSLIVTDLLADVIVYPDGFVKVLDIDELAIAYEKHLCSAQALKKLDNLLNLIYADKFDTLSSKINQWIR